MEKDNKFTLIQTIALICVSCLSFTKSFGDVTVSAVRDAFPMVALDTIRLITTVPTGVGVIFALISGQLSRKLSIKKIVIIAFIVQYISNLIIVMGSASFGVLFAGRVLYGAGWGLALPMLPSAVTYFFTGKTLDKLSSIRQAFSSILGSLFMILAGYLALYHWSYAYLGIYITIPFLILIILKMPENTPVAESDSKDETAPAGKEKKFTAMTYIVVLGSFCFQVAAMSYITNNSIFVTASGVGDVAFAGQCSSVFTMCSLFAGLAYFAIKSFFKQFNMVLIVAVMASSLIVLTTTNSATGFMLGSVLFGIGWGLQVPQFTITIAGTATNRKYAAITTSLYSASVGLGQFASGIILPVIRDTFNITHARPEWVISSVGLLVGAVILIFFESGVVMKARKQTSAAQKQA